MIIKNRVLPRMISRLRWILDSFIWGFIRLFRASAKKMRARLPVAIGITTFLNRFDIFFKPLVRRLVFLFPGCRIIVAANGSVLREEQQRYLHELREFCGGYADIELIAYENPVGLSHLWNRIMDRAGSDRVLMLNDDLKLKTGFGKFLVNSGILKEGIATINSSWSHFLISQEIFSIVGPFDEELREVGGEDDDYLARLALKGRRPADYRCDAVARKKKRRRRVPQLNSYGKDMTKEAGGYSSYNTDYLRRKWEISDVFFEGAVEIPRRRNKYWKLKSNGPGQCILH
jgi:hypothetical protein